MNQPLNVCLLNDSFPPVIDGVANAVLNYANVIQGGLGGAVVATPHYPMENDNYSFPVIRYPSVKVPKTAGYRMGIPVASRIVREARRYDVNIIHSHCPFSATVVSKSLRRAIGAPIILTYHTKFDIDIANTLRTKHTRSIALRFIVSNIKACDEVWVVSPGAGENLRSIGYEGDYRVMGNGVDFPRGRCTEDEIAQISREHGLEEDVPVFLFVGRMMWYKGIKIIIDGLRDVKAAGQRFKMIFIGSGSDFDEISACTAKYGMSDDCIFTGAIADRARLRAYFSRADLFLFPSTFDTNGLVVREAAACGLASVLIRGSSAAEMICDGKNGILIDEDPADLAAAVMQIAQNTGRAKEIGRHAMDELYISWDEAVATAYSRYYEVLEAYNKSRRKK